MNKIPLTKKIMKWKENSIITEGGCWIWKGKKNYKGYAEVRVNGRICYLHRISASYYHDFDLSSALQVLHKPLICKSRACWNPEHIYVGTTADNVRDRGIDGKLDNSRKKTCCRRGHEYAIVGFYVNKKGGKDCKECIRIRSNN